MRKLARGRDERGAPVRGGRAGGGGPEACAAVARIAVSEPRGHKKPGDPAI
jgi:hypothetical protein